MALAPASVPVAIVGCRRAAALEELVTTLVTAWEVETGLSAGPPASGSFEARQPMQSIIMVVDEGGPEAVEVASLLSSLRARYGPTSPLQVFVLRYVDAVGAVVRPPPLPNATTTTTTTPPPPPVPIASSAAAPTMAVLQVSGTGEKRKLLQVEEAETTTGPPVSPGELQRQMLELSLEVRGLTKKLVAQRLVVTDHAATHGASSAETLAAKRIADETMQLISAKRREYAALAAQKHKLAISPPPASPTVPKPVSLGTKVGTAVGAAKKKKRPRANVALIKRLKRMWLWMLSELFVNATEVNGPHTVFETDVVFLEDDLLVAPDFFKVARFMAGVKQAVPGVSVSAMAGWGGEHLVNAQLLDYVIQQQKRPFPNMGYAVNASLVRQLFNESSPVHEEFHRPPKRGKAEREDWDNSMGRVLESDVLPGRVVRPTFSRVWHRGAKGVHEWESDFVRQLPPWYTYPLEAFAYHPSRMRVKTRLRDVFGYPCGDEPIAVVRDAAADACAHEARNFTKRFQIFCVDEPHDNIVCPKLI
jgi:hypothetical protein